LGIAIKCPEGLVLAAESRVTLNVPSPGGGFLPVSYDNATKLLSFTTPNTSVAAVTYGAGSIGLRTASSFIPELEATFPGGRLSVADFSGLLFAFFQQQWQNAMPMPPDYAG